MIIVEIKLYSEDRKVWLTATKSKAWKICKSDLYNGLNIVKWDTYAECEYDEDEEEHHDTYIVLFVR